DVTREADWKTAVDLAVSRFGKLNVLVNNAGISAHGRVEDTTEEAWDRVMDINAKGVFLGTKAAIPAMRRAGGGSVINISSQLGLVGTDNTSPQYPASKGAVRLLTKVTAIQYAKEKIRANSVHPGPIVTAMTERRRSDPAQKELMVSRIPLGRYGEPEEVAYCVLFLASDESSFVTGSARSSPAEVRAATTDHPSEIMRRSLSIIGDRRVTSAKVSAIEPLRWRMSSRANLPASRARVSIRGVAKMTTGALLRFCPRRCTMSHATLSVAVPRTRSARERPAVR